MIIAHPPLSLYLFIFCYYCFLKDSSDSSVCGLRARSVNRTTEMKFSWLPCFNVGDQQTWVPEGFHPICGVDSLAKSNTTVRSHQAPSPHAPKCLISDCVWGFFTFLKYNSVFHYTLATTTGGKDSGLPIGYQKMTAWPNMFALLSLVGLGCCFLLFLFFSVLVWHTRSLPSISHGSKSTETSFIFLKRMRWN